MFAEQFAMDIDIAGAYFAVGGHAVGVVVVTPNVQ
jgi:hypothetical protein